MRRPLPPWSCGAREPPGARRARPRAGADPSAEIRQAAHTGVTKEYRPSLAELPTLRVPDPRRENLASAGPLRGRIMRARQRLEKRRFESKH